MLPRQQANVAVLLVFPVREACVMSSGESNETSLGEASAAPKVQRRVDYAIATVFMVAVVVSMGGWLYLLGNVFDDLRLAFSLRCDRELEHQTRSERRIPASGTCVSEPEENPRRVGGLSASPRCWGLFFGLERGL